MKGIDLPINVIVIVAIVVLVLAVIGVFFLMTSTGQLSRTNAERYFSQGCTDLCDNPCQSYYLIGWGIEAHDTRVTDMHTQFKEACLTLGHTADILSTAGAKQCLEACGDYCEVECEMPAF